MRRYMITGVLRESAVRLPADKPQRVVMRLPHLAANDLP